MTWRTARTSLTGAAVRVVRVKGPVLHSNAQLPMRHDDCCSNQSCNLPRNKKGKQVALAVARGLGYLHQNGVIHRCDQLVSSGAAVSPAQDPGSF